MVTGIVQNFKRGLLFPAQYCPSEAGLGLAATSLSTFM